ncbi:MULTISPECIES: pyruvate kinase [unclassified Breznakia]|uniref:pyruvate kinase n=1 Tax=unclassified Breznakia TaxID=2623764 RepID=UPI0024759334|nr:MULTISPECIES: pyruvate kinase [unclassified Breznakia]MDH6366439.1 pyruvate kinase [Breznakia sp. PH1-1]MDH6403532.1 pyruvate kinase [Breznakia sp. PF1-11]MDH6411241.1 pyruvate kinase [Breznakia sp. PFB1-11]MDH6413496.1 pyruvate kinase [Breznakia sp. PFB1-14]MDH6415786.1 pyruvate kinase [Breznakia sp. PFB1-4]
MKKTKIICTIGPATESPEMLKKLVETGMNISRLNFSHGDYEEHGNRIKNIRKVNEELDSNIGILLDTKGPEIRLGDFKNGQESYKAGDIVTLVREPILGTHDRVHVQCPEVFDDVQEGGTFLIDDGKVRLTILEKKDGELVCRVENPGVLKSKKGCNVPNVKLSMPFVSEKDANDIRFGCKNKVDYIAASFTRRKDDIMDIRKILKEEGQEDIQIIAKIENQEGYDNLDEILQVADGIMVARGDLGVDVSFEKVPIYQKEMIKRANAYGKPVVTATHMLESMQQNPRPTRAEASDVANAVLDGTDAIMLSGESAVGMYPIEAVQTMVTISEGMEAILPYREKLRTSISTSKRTKSDAIGIAVADTVLAMDIAAIVCFTSSGTSARRISKFRPDCPILAATFDERTRHALTINWGVNAMVVDKVNNLDNESELASDVAKEFGCKKGDTIIVVAGYPHGSGATNSMRIIEVE